MDTQTFAKKIKEKYPQYAGVDDATLVSKMVEKYPQYRTQITDIAQPEVKSSFQERLQDQTMGGVVRNGQTTRPSEDIVQDFTQAGENIQQTFSDAAKKVQEAKNDPNQSKVRGLLQSTGIAAGAIADALGTGLMTMVKGGLSQDTENKIKAKIGNTVQKLSQTPGGEDIKILSQSFKDFYNNELTPEQQRDVDAVGGVAKLFTEIEGVGKVSKVASAGVDVAKQGIDVTRQATEQAFKNVSENASKLTLPKIKEPSFSNFKLAKDIIEDIKPRAVDIGDRQIAKALNLAPGEDIAGFKRLTGNDLGEFMGRNDLIKDTTGETVQELANFQKLNHEAKKDIVSLVEDRFTFEDAPEFEGLIDNLLDDLGKSKSPEFKQQVQILNDIKKAGDFDLTQMEYVKALSDDVNSFYTRTGDVRSGVQVKGEEDLVKATRRFIEDIVSTKYPGVNIRELNRNTQSSRFILDTIAKRAGKSDTRSLASLGDYAVLGIGSNVTPGVGIVALLGKKVFESAPIRLRIARRMYKKAGIEPGESITPRELAEINKLIKKELDEIMGQPTKKSKTTK